METNGKIELAERLHDEPVQVLAGAALRLEVALRKIEDTEVADTLQGAAEGVDRALNFLRGLIAELRGDGGPR